MGKGGTRAWLEPQGGHEVVDGVFHVGLHSGYHDMTDVEFVVMDQILRRELEKVIGESDSFDKDSCAQYAKNPEATLKKTLTRDIHWDNIEREFMQIGFWKRQGDVRKTHSSFDAYEANVALLQLTKFWRSRQGLMGKQAEEVLRFIPQARHWFRELVDDYDVSHHIELDMGKVWDAMGDIAEGSNRELTGGGRNRQTTTQQSFLDTGVVRLPDLEIPRVKVFRLRLTVWGQSSDGLITKSGIRGELKTCSFVPRDEHMKSIHEELKLVRSANRLWLPKNLEAGPSWLKPTEEPVPRPRPTGALQSELLGGGKALPVGSPENPDRTDKPQRPRFSEVESACLGNKTEEVSSPLPSNSPVGDSKSGTLQSESQESLEPDVPSNSITNYFEGAQDFRVGSMAITNSTTTHTTHVNNGHTTHTTHITKTKHITNNFFIILPKSEGLDDNQAARLMEEAVKQSRLVSS